MREDRELVGPVPVGVLDTFRLLRVVAAWAYREPQYARAAAVLSGFKPDSDINLTIAPWSP
jgi:hypothetical protein